METLTFTDTPVTVPSNKPYEQVIRALESVLGEGNVRSFTEMVGVTGYVGRVRSRHRAAHRHERFRDLRQDRPRRVNVPGFSQYEGKALRDRQLPHRQADT